MKQKEYLFYDTFQTYLSDKRIYEEMKNFLPEIKSIIDIGCGMAAFAKVFQENGVKEIKLIDHPSLDVSKCLIKENFEFIPCDLDNELPKSVRADLVICTEVLEHINLRRSITILDFIASCADIIIFSAAVPRQGGVGHINEQRHSFWINEFKKRGFDYSDAFKTNVIKDEEIFYWLRQNIFIFYKNQNKNSPLINSKWIGEKFEVVSHQILNKEYGFFELFKMLPKAFFNSLFKRLKASN